MKELLQHRTELVKEIGEASNPYSCTRPLLAAALADLDRLIQKYIEANGTKKESST